MGKKIFNFFYEVRLERTIASIFSLLVILIMFMNVVLRFGFHFAFNWGEEIIRYLNFFAACFAISAGFQCGKHISITVVTEHVLPERFRKYMRLAADIMSLIFMLFLVYFGFILVGKLHMSGQTSSALHIPMYLLYAGIPICGILSSIQILFKIFIDKSYLVSRDEASTLE